MMSLASILGTIVVTTTAAATALRLCTNSSRNESPADISKLRQLCESPIEERMFDELVKRKIIPHPQYEIFNYRLDFAIDPNHLKINVECDGRDYHDVEWEQIEHDRKRNAYLTSNGWSVLRFSGRDIHRNAQACAKMVEKTIRTRQKQLKIS